MNTGFFSLVFEAVKAIPAGKVASYGYIASVCGYPRWSRQVGYALHRNPDPQTIPCHRVVTANGCCSKAFAFGGQNAQRTLLENEGVTLLDNGNVDMAKCALKRS